jgi:hypothetical protein
MADYLGLKRPMFVIFISLFRECIEPVNSRLGGDGSKGPLAPETVTRSGGSLHFEQDHDGYRCRAKQEIK